MIEKHFTLDKTLSGNDHYHAMDPEDAKKIIEGINHIDNLLGDSSLGFSETEAAARMNARRSIVAAYDIEKGQAITREMLTFKRPGTGISPSEIDAVLGSKAVANIRNDELISYSMLER